MYSFLIFNGVFLCVSILCYVALHKTGKFRLNRWLLLSLPPLFYSLINIGSIETVSEAVGFITLPVVTIGENSGVAESINYIPFIYLSGIVLTTGYFLYAVIRILRLRKDQNKDTFNGVTIYRGEITASFFKLIYIDKQLDDTETQLAIDHEKAHADQWHSLDRVYAVIVQALLWFNPGVYLWKKMIIENHEYLADEEVLKKETKKNYGHFLLHQELRSPQPAYHLTSNMSNLKSRIMQMNRTKRKAAWVYLVIPAMALTTLSFTVTSTKNVESTKIVEQDQNDPISKPDVYPSFKGGNEAMGTYISKEIKYPKSAMESSIEGKVFVSFTVTSKGEIIDVSALKSPNEDLSKEAVRVVKGMPDWNPGEKDGQKVSVKMNLPIMCKLPVKE